MYRESKSFLLRIELEAAFPEDYEGDEDGGEWLRTWTEEVRPQVIASVLRTLASTKRYTIQPRSRGKSTEDEVEISVELQVSAVRNAD